MQADWDSTANRPAAPERMYKITRDSVSVWLSGSEGRDTIAVIYVLDVERMPVQYADPLRILPLYAPVGPTIHTHQNYCDMTHWGPDYASCSNTRPESHQCQPSLQDRRTQINEGHSFDVIECGREQWVFYLNPEA